MPAPLWFGAARKTWVTQMLQWNKAYSHGEQAEQNQLQQWALGPRPIWHRVLVGKHPSLSASSRPRPLPCGVLGHGSRIVVSVLVVQPRDHVADRTCGCCHCPASPESIIWHSSGPGKDQNSKFEVRFLLNAFHFHTLIKSENPKSNRCKLGTIYINKWTGTTSQMPSVCVCVWMCARACVRMCAYMCNLLSLLTEEYIVSGWV